MKYLIEACADHPEKQRALYIMTYVKMISEMDKRKERAEFDEVN